MNDEPDDGRRTHERRWLGAAALAAGLLLVAPVASLAQDPARAQQSEFQRLFGGYTLDEPVARVEQRIGHAIERSTEDLNIIMRGMVRGRLQDNNPVIRRLRIATRGQDLAVSTNGQTIAAPAGGSERAMEVSGEHVEASYAFADGRLHQILEYGRGTRRNTFALRPDGRLGMTVSLAADLLPQPVTYRMIFRRTQP